MVPILSPAPLTHSKKMTKRKSSPHIVTPELGKNIKAYALDPLAAVFRPALSIPPIDATNTPPPPDGKLSNAPVHSPATSPPADRTPSQFSTGRTPPAPPAPGARHHSSPPPVARDLLSTRYRYPEGRPPDALDNLVRAATDNFLRSNTWTDFFDRQRDPRGDWSNLRGLQHPAGHLLRHYQRLGVPVKMTTKQWTNGQKTAALQRGPHKSAKEHVDFLREEFTSMMEKGHWALLPARLLKHLPDTRFSPLGVVPQHERRPRTISDYSFYGINADTLQLAPPEAMQFGRALQRLLHRIHQANPRYGPVYLSKIDIADGFYRLGIRPDDAPRLAVLFPTKPGEEQLVGIPLTLPMGWLESPPAFCAMTETTADLANAVLDGKMDPIVTTAHRLDKVSETPETALIHTPTAPVGTDFTEVPSQETDSIKYQRPMRYWDVYVDDFLGLVQGGKSTRTKVKRALLHSLDAIMRPVSALDNPHRQEPASVKKLRKGDATWSTRKIMLGWVIDTVDGTIELSTRRRNRLLQLLRDIDPTQKVIATKVWHKVLGELRSMALAIPGARGLFSLLQEVFRHEESTRPRLRLTRAAHGFLDDFRWLARDLSARPTRIAELIPTEPSIVGACDAAGTGMGGVFFVPSLDGSIQPYLWRYAFPQTVQSQLVSFSQPNGSITNSDLELCGNVAHHDVIAQLADVRERTIWTGSDNTANVYWQRKGSTTTTGPAAYLLRDQALHQRQHRYVPQHDYVPGTANVMADDCSRLWHLTDAQLLTHFNFTYPQTKSWLVCHLNSEMSSRLKTSLFRRTSPMASHQRLPTPRIPTGKSGTLFAEKPALTRSSGTTMTPSRSSLCSAMVTTKDTFPPAVNLSQLLQFRTSSAPSARCCSGWGPKTHASPSTTENSISDLPGKCNAGKNPNRPHCESAPSRSP